MNWFRETLNINMPGILIFGSTIFVLVMVGCTSTPTSAPPLLDSPPPPGPASSAVVELSMKSFVTGDVSISSTGSRATIDPKGTAREVKLRDLEGSGEYAFGPKELVFKIGDSINFVIVAETEFHTFTVEDLGIDESADVGQQVTFNFKFDQAGTFALICIPHEAQGMVGTITVQ